MNENEYPPEVVVFVTSEVSTKIRKQLCPAFCTRILEVPYISIPHNDTNGEGDCHVSSWDTCGYTKLNIFRYENYRTILYIDSDCLVLKDIKFLLQLSSSKQHHHHEDKVKDFSETMLIAAAPDIFPPDKFNGGVLIIRPLKKGFEDMIKQTKHLPTYDGGDTGFLNSYFSTWYTGMPSTARLPFGCNAQRFMHHCTYEKQPNYWDMGIEEITIVHYSSSPKPWQKDQLKSKRRKQDGKDEDQSFLTNEDQNKLSQALLEKNNQLDQLWNRSYERSQKWYLSWKEEQEWNSKVSISASKERQLKTKKSAPPRKNSKQEKNNSHLKITKRFKELRKSGFSSKDAMLQATAEIDGKDSSLPDPGSQVASMFGLTM